MSMTKLIVTQTEVPVMVAHLSKKDEWDKYEMVIVRDEDYREAMEIICRKKPNMLRLSILEMAYNAD